MPDITSDAVQPGTRLRHKSLGLCEFVRTDGPDLIVQHVESGMRWRFPAAAAKQYFEVISGERKVARAMNAGMPTTVRPESNGQKRLQHTTLGECVLVRTEGVDWIIRPVDSTSLFRCPPQARRFLTEITEPETRKPQIADARADTEDDDVTSRPGPSDFDESTPRTELPSKAIHRDGSAHETAEPTQHRPVNNRVEIRPETDTALNRRLLKRAFESLRNGLPPDDRIIQQFAIGMEETVPLLDRMLDSVHLEGGNAGVIRGAYGQGKTFSLKMLEQRALDAGYLVASTEIDAYENKIEKPHHIYRALMSSLRIPGSSSGGVVGLLARTVEYLRDKFPAWYLSGREHEAEAVRQHLAEEIQCEPLAWLLSDPSITEKDSLIGLLACEPGIRVGQARLTHLLRAQPRYWPAFKAGTQGDFASYVLCGLGRLARLLEFRGLLIVLDEMEKWEALDWRAQCRAGNLFGGLIWGATAETGNRSCHSRDRFPGSTYLTWENCNHGKDLQHSGLCGGYPFTTPDRCFVGVTVAMTPRGDNGPEDDWSHYGVLEVIDLPPFHAGMLRDYLNRLAPLYQEVYSLSDRVPNELASRSLRRWQNFGDESARSATRAVIETLDEWRDQQPLPV